MLIALGMIGSWVLHITEAVTPELRIWIYFTIAMLAFFFYGIHESSLFDLAPVMIIVILIMSGTEKHIFVRLCAIMYFFTMTYSILFVAGDELKFDALNITRIILHFALVLIADFVVKSMINERKKMRKSIDNKISELEEINHQTENFLVNVSHELRTPINAITGFTSLMLDQEKDESKRKNIISVQKAGRRLFDQIEGILDYAEIDMGKMELSRNEYMISTVVNDVALSEQKQISDNSPKIIYDIAPSIPKKLVGDEKKIKKILRHLIDNAVKFTPQGEVTVEISCMTKPYGINLCIKVSDTGIGIREEDIKKLSHRFYQLDGERNRNASGLGLGLPIVYGIVSLMGGFVKIESKEGVGTTVSVSIPQEVAETAETDTDYLDTRKIYCPDIRVLVVDDEPMNLMVAEGIFKDYGMKVKLADSGEKAIEICMREEFDIIFLDHMMPEMDGVETLKNLKKLNANKNKKPVIIAFTANAVSGAKSMFLEQGFDDFISKPIERIELDRVLKRVLPNDAIRYVSGDDINKQSGLSYCQGDEDLYKKILTGFVRESDAKKENMKACLASGDLKNYRISVHSLKSTAKMIGADELSKMAEAAEMAAKTEDADYINMHGEELILKYDETVKSISNMLDLKPVDYADENHKNDAEALSKEDFCEILKKLKESLDTYEEVKALKIIEEVSDASYGGTPLENILYDIMHDIDNFDISGALKKTEKLMDEVKDGDVK